MSTEDKQEDFDLAIFNLDGVTDPSDLKKCALQIQSYLKLCGDTSLEKIQSSADVTTVANIFALTGSVLDLILYSVSPKQDDDGVKQVALLAINLIGLFPDPQNEAFTRVALRPMLGLMAECLYKKKGKIRQSDIKRMQLHLNHQIAGDLGKFIDETQGRIGELLASAATLAVQILQSIANPTFGIAIGAASSGASADTRDPDQQFTNWAKPLSELAATSTFVPISINPLQISRLQLEASEAISSVTSVINAQSSGDKYSIAWLIAETKKVLAGMKNKGTANVPINQTGEYERETNGQTLEFVSLQADALLEPPCPDSETNSTSNRISFSMGTEKVSHSDFYIPEIDFTYNRLYSSQLLELDQSVVGSRWMMPFSNIIKKQDEHYVYIDGRARTHYVPKSILKKAYEIPYEGIKITAVEEDILCIDSGDGWRSYYLRQENLEDFYPYAFLTEKNNNEIKLYYQNLYQKIYLQRIEFNIKNKKCTLKFAYNDLGKVIAIFKGDEVKPLSEYVYSAQGDLIQAVDQNGHIRNYEYNAYHQLTRYTDRTGRGQNIRYESINAKARAIEEWADDDYFHTRLEWHKKLRQVAIFNAENLPTYYYYDLFGFTYRIRLADGREQWTYRDNKKRIIKQIDFFGRETNQEYNDQDQLSKVNLPNGGVIRFAYDEDGNLSETKDPEGNIWKQEYDDQGNMVKQINPLGHTQQYKYNSDHQVVMITDSKGGQKQVQYNDLGQMIAFKDCSGKLSQWKYDELGRLIEEISAEDQKVHYQYSEAGVDKGYLKTITYSDGLKEQFDRDQEGRLLRHVGTKGDITQYQYDKTGLLQHRIDPNRHQISYHWNKLGQLIRLTNQNQADYLFDYDEYGQLIREKAFDGEEKYYAYNENGLLSEIRQANIVTTLDYGADTKLVYRQLKHSQSGVSQEEYFHYNLNGNLNQVSNADSQNDWYYNALGQVEREHQQYKLPNQKPMVAIIRYRYDELGNLINTIRPDKQEIDWLNYGSGHVYAIALNQQDIIGFKRDNLHRETERYLISGLIEKKCYNDVGLLSSQHIFSDDDASYIQYQADRHYQYDQNYFLTQVKDSRLGTYEYKYDPIGRLIKAQNKNMQETYLFDPAGNLLDPDDYLEQHLKNNTLKAFLGAHYHYDEQGNVREKQTINNVLKLNWDNSNRLIASEQNGQKTKYAYDVFGRRIYKQTENEGLTLFGWDGDQMIWESYASDHPFKKNKLYQALYLRAK
ncbi:RHS repeat protein [Acinetobacter gerneri]|jgi:YD repeat-containing protein|uniref:RHS repeat protein n=1 Tax=Acinetobacter gerneri TaxID=202952 RepID=UPI0023F482B7|nr:RHS repeat protein [Acinetobacter gerneri]